MKIKSTTMDYVNLASKETLRRVHKHPNDFGLRYKEYGRSMSISDYSDEEITEMLLGVYRYTKHLLVDGNYFIDINNVIQTGCVLEEISYKKKPLLNAEGTGNYNVINNIDYFYIKGYFLITENEVNGKKKHFINSYLLKAKAMRPSRSKHKGLYCIKNSYKCLQTFENGYFPKDLYHAIKLYINDPFFNNQYKISDFIVESEIKINLA